VRQEVRRESASVVEDVNLDPTVACRCAERHRAASAAERAVDEIADVVVRRPGHPDVLLAGRCDIRRIALLAKAAANQLAIFTLSSTISARMSRSALDTQSPEFDCSESGSTTTSR
jgi:hypothetical protein